MHTVTETETKAVQPGRTDDRPIAVGVVSFLNTLPLIDGLDQLSDLHLQYSVPSRLIEQLLAGEVEIALCSSIDYQVSPEPLIIVPVGVLASHGPTLTVRLYSSLPLNELEAVYCDSDSHTSVALMRIILAERYNITPRIIEYNAREHVAGHKPVEWPEAMLLIGDKVVTDSPPAVRYPHQLDLGEAWAEDTGLPFVFAVWMAREDADASRIAVAAAVLHRQRLHNRERIDRMIHQHASRRNWPRDLAESYLRSKLQYAMTDAHRKSLDLFFDRADKHALIDHRRAIEVIDI